MFKQINKLKDKARRALEELAGAFEDQLVPRRQPVPVRVPVNKPRRGPPFSRNFTTSAVKQVPTATKVQFLRPQTHIGPRSRSSLLSSLASNYWRYSGYLAPVLRSQKLSSPYRAQLVNRSFSNSFVKVMTSFTVVKDLSKYYNDITKRYDNIGVKVVIPGPVGFVSNGPASVYTVLESMEQKLQQLTATVSSLRDMAKLGDLPVSANDSHIAVNFDLTKAELCNLLVDNQINHMPIVEAGVKRGVLDQWNTSLGSAAASAATTAAPYTVKMGLGSYTVNTSDMSGGI